MNASGEAAGRTSPRTVSSPTRTIISPDRASRSMLLPVTRAVPSKTITCDSCSVSPAIISNCPGSGESHACTSKLNLIRATLRRCSEDSKDCALRQRECGRLIVESCYVKLGRTAEINSTVVYVESGVGIWLRPEGLTSCDRVIASCSLPIVLIRRVVRHRAINESDATNSSRRICQSCAREDCSGINTHPIVTMRAASTRKHVFGPRDGQSIGIPFHWGPPR